MQVTKPSLMKYQTTYIEEIEDYENFTIPEVLVRHFIWENIRRRNKKGSDMDAVCLLYHELKVKRPKEYLLQSEIETSYRELSNMLKWSLSRVERFISILKDYNLCTTRYYQDKLLINLDPRTSIDLDVEIENENAETYIFRSGDKIDFKDGIYFLINISDLDTRVIYIGVSYSSISKRIATHKRDKKFTHVGVVKMSNMFLHLYEKVFIGCMNPKHNIKDTKFEPSDLQRKVAKEIIVHLSKKLAEF